MLKGVGKKRDKCLLNMLLIWFSLLNLKHNNNSPTNLFLLFDKVNFYSFPTCLAIVLTFLVMSFSKFFISNFQNQHFI